MSGYVFPVGKDDDHPPRLYGGMFYGCYVSLSALIDEESRPSPAAGKYPVGMVLAQQRKQAQDSLTYWWRHVSDGDLGFVEPTWTNLEQAQIRVRDKPLQDLGVELDKLKRDSNWRGSARDDFTAHLSAVRTRVDALCRSHPGNSGDIGCYIAQVGILLKAACAVQAAYKKDLYQIAKKAHDLIQAIDSGADAAAEVGLLTLAIAGLALSGLGAVAMASSIAARVFLGGAIAEAGSWAFGSAADTFPLGSGTVVSIMDSVRGAVDRATREFTKASEAVSAAMDTLWTTLNSENSELKAYPKVRPVDTAPSASFNPAHYQPGA